VVDIDQEETRVRFVLEPNRSMSWETNKKILFVMFLVNLLIGISFSLVGAWLILPFAGLEILLVGIGMYYVCWKLNFKEIITIESESFVLQKGVYYPKKTWQWQFSHTRLVKQPNRYRMSAPRLLLEHYNESVELGEFLNRKDKKILKEALQKHGLACVVSGTK